MQSFIYKKRLFSLEDGHFFAFVLFSYPAVAESRLCHAKDNKFNLAKTLDMAGVVCYKIIASEY